MDYLLVYLVFALFINVLMFIPAYLKQTDKLTDISYGASFAIVGAFAYFRSEMNIAHTILFIAVFAWSARIGAFLLYRVRKVGKDSRFDEMRKHFFKFLRFWVLQGLSVFIILISSIIAWGNSSFNISAIGIAGLTLFIAGLLTEATADIQKFRFNSKPSNKGKWIDEGLWRKSRHPNYLGEMSVWTGLYIYALSSMSGWGIVIGLVSPLYIIMLLSFGSGIPILEKGANERWGRDKDYQDYKSEVPVLIPSVKSLKR